MSSCGTPTSDLDGVTEYSISDDGQAAVDLPFNYTFPDGTVVTKSFMKSNGAIVFMLANGSRPGGAPNNSFCCSGQDVASQDFSNVTGLPFFSYSIAALWTDLIDLNVDVDGDGIEDTGFFTQELDTNKDGNTDTLRYFWQNISEFFNRETHNTFGAEISADGSTKIHHFDIDIRNHSVTVGVFGDPRAGDIQQFEFSQGSYSNDQFTTYEFNLAGACEANPLISTSCNGHAEALAELIFQQNCAADPLFDSSCPGFAQAFLTQQCNADPLFDSSCNGFEEALFAQNCEADPLFDEACPGFEQAHFETFVLPTLQQQEQEAAGLSDEADTTVTTTEEDLAFSSDPVASITEVAITGDPAVDEVLSEPEPIVIDIPVIEPQPVAEEPPTQEIAATEEEPVEEIIEIAAVEEEVEELVDEPVEEASEDEESDESSSDVEEQSDSEGDETNDESAESESDDSESDGEGDSESEKSDSKDKKKSEKKKSKKEKLKDIATKRAMQLAERMSNAATLEAQQAVQAQILTLINYVPDFLKYGGALQGGYYADATSYPDKELPQNPSALRNGLAQQLLHEKMIDMQYE